MWVAKGYYVESLTIDTFYAECLKYLAMWSYTDKC